MKLFKSTYNDRQLKKVEKIADAVLALEGKMAELSDAELKGMTLSLRAKLAEGASLDSILPEAFAACREANWRVLGLKPYRVQVIGGIVLHQGRIAEMKTGEGKTLVATMPAYLNALTGNGVHIVTVNDYLAKRDSEQMGKVFRFLGLSVGVITHDIPAENRKAMYDADITYGTNNEFGFDYLRDNMVVRKESKTQRGHAFAIIDEVDSILIDEARTPLIISGQGKCDPSIYMAVDRLVKTFHTKRIKEFDKTSDEYDQADADYLVFEKTKNTMLTARGIQKVEAAFGLENYADPKNMELAHYVEQSIRANGIMRKDVDYIVDNGEIIIVDEFTGRLMRGRRFNDGLHQAIEAKEGVKIAGDSMTYATVTFQNFFRLYAKLSGMTGTAATEEEEFRQIYNLDVVVIPTNKPVIRCDHPDHVYATAQAKERAIIRQIKACYEKEQPVLVGTVSVEKSERLSKLLDAEGIKHTVLNAKYHEKEAEIVAQAGRSGAVTIATNMAGRGTDIVLGGNPEYMAAAELRKRGVPEDVLSEAMGFAETDDESVVEVRAQYRQYCRDFGKETSQEAEKVRAAGGLYILGTERHESRRIDNQLRGRAGRQGDPGESRFFLSLDDQLLRLFIPDGAMKRFISSGLDEDEPLDSRMISSAVESAQKRLEGQNFDIRKNVLQYDDVLNQQRIVMYASRDRVLDGENFRETVLQWCATAAENLYDTVCEKGRFTEKSVMQLDRVLSQAIQAAPGTIASDKTLQALPDKKKADTAKGRICNLLKSWYEQKEALIGPAQIRGLERAVILKAIDLYWIGHIDAMTKLKDGIGMQAYGQSDPVVAYKRQAFEMYEEMQANIQVTAVLWILGARATAAPPASRQASDAAQPHQSK